MTDAATPPRPSPRSNRRGAHFSSRRRGPRLAVGLAIVALAAAGAGYAAYVGATGATLSGPTLASSTPASVTSTSPSSTPQSTTSPSSTPASATSAASSTTSTTQACPAGQPVSPASVHVQVANGSGVTDQATTTATALRQLGYQASVNLTADNYTYTTSVIEYAPDSAAAARQLQATLRSGGQLRSDAALTPTPFNVEIITGKNFAGVGAPAAASGC